MNYRGLIRLTLIIIAAISFRGTGEAQTVMLKNVADNGRAVFSDSTYRLVGALGQTFNGAVKGPFRSRGPGQQSGVQPVVDLEKDPENLPKDYRLEPNYPNPFNAGTTIKYALPKESLTRITIHNILGQNVRTLIDKQQEAGFYQISWDGKAVDGGQSPSGIYLVRIVAGDFVAVRKMLFVK